MISTCHGPLRQPIVPKSRPMSQTASAQPETSRSVTSGRAEVVKSRSFWSRPIIASRTGPPTSASSSPASANRAPSSSMTEPMRSSSAPTRRWISTIVSGGRAASDTTGQSTCRPGSARTTSIGACPARPSFRAALAGLLTAGLAWPAAPSAPARRRRPAEEQRPPASCTSTRSTRCCRAAATSRSPARSPTSATRPSPGSTCTRSPRSRRSSTRVSLANSAASDPGELRRRTGDGARHLRHGRRARARPDRVLLRHRAGGAARDDPREQGVYWIGIHALGDSAVPRDDVADGRARTFIPARPSGDGSPGDVRHPADPQPRLVRRRRLGRRHRAVGAAARGGRQPRRRARHGRVRRRDAVQLARSTRPCCVALSPAGRRQPARSLGPDPSVPVAGADADRGRPAEGTDGAARTPAPRARPRPRPDAAGAAEEPTAEEARSPPQPGVARPLRRTRAARSPVLALPYGDLDVSAAVRSDRDALRPGRRPQRRGDGGAGAAVAPAVAPASDRAEPGGPGPSPPRPWSCSGDSAFDFPPTTPNSVVRILGHKVRRHQHRAPSPAARADRRPTTRWPCASGCSARRRSGCSTATRRRSWSPCPRSGAARTPRRSSTDLEQPWLDVVPGRGDRRRPQRRRPARVGPRLHRPRTRQRSSTAANFTAATRADQRRHPARAGAHSADDRSRARSRDEALVTLSEQHRDRPRLALAPPPAGRTRTSGRARQDPDRGAAGGARSPAPPDQLGATLVNGLDQPVSVEVRADDRRRADAHRRRRRARRSAAAARSVLRFEASTDAGSACTTSGSSSPPSTACPLGSVDAAADPGGPGQRPDVGRRWRSARSCSSG